MMVTTETLSRLSLFEGLPQEDLEALTGLCQEVTCHRGEILFREGETAKKMYILLEGVVTIQVQLTSRPESITVGVINQPGQVVGWSGLVAPRHYTATAICQADSRLLSIEGDACMRLLEENPEMGFRIFRQIAEVISSRLRNTRVALLKTL